MAADPNAVRELLQKLATDDAVRESVESDPVNTFAEYGLDLDPALVPKGVTLPSKEDILENLEEYVEKGAEDTFFLIIFFQR